MGPELIDLFQKACDLPEEERATLAGLLIESLDSEWEAGVDEAWAKEIDRRIAELDSDEVEPIPWEEVRARLLRSLDER